MTLRCLTTLALCLGLSGAAAVRAQSSLHLESVLTAGTAGVGIDLGLSFNSHLDARVGISYMPPFHGRLPMTFALQEGFEHKLNKEEKDNYKKKQKEWMRALSDFAGIEFDNQVNIHLVPTLFQGKILLDWYPFHRKHWHFTTGFYFGPSRVAKAYNYDDDTAFLQALNGYNTIWQHVVDDEPIIEYGDEYVEFSPAVNKKIRDLGHASFYIGTKKDGTYYHSTPSPDGHVYADCYANRFRPYLGFGYNTTIGQTGRCTLGFDCGSLFWGGSPHIITHDGVDMAYDMDYIVKGNLRRIVNTISALKVYPLLEVRLAWQLF